MKWWELQSNIHITHSRWLKNWSYLNFIIFKWFLCCGRRVIHITSERRLANHFTLTFSFCNYTKNNVKLFAPVLGNKNWKFDLIIQNLWMQTTNVKKIESMNFKNWSNWCYNFSLKSNKHNWMQKRKSNNRFLRLSSSFVFFLSLSLFSLLTLLPRLRELSILDALAVSALSSSFIFDAGIVCFNTGGWTVHERGGRGSSDGDLFLHFSDRGLNLEKLFWLGEFELNFDFRFWRCLDLELLVTLLVADVWEAFKTVSLRKSSGATSGTGFTKAFGVVDPISRFGSRRRNQWFLKKRDMSKDSTVLATYDKFLKNKLKLKPYRRFFEERENVLGLKTKWKIVSSGLQPYCEKQKIKLVSNSCFLQLQQQSCLW